MRKFIDGINECLKWTIIIAMFVMLFVIFIQVIFRYVFQHSLTFSEELARYLFVYIVFFGTAVVARENGHIVVGVLVQRLKGKIAKYTKVAAYTSIILFVTILFYHGSKIVTLTSYQLSPALRIPMSYIYLAIPVASFVMFCNMLILIIDTLRSKS